MNDAYSLLSPRERHRRDLQRPGFVADPAQVHAVDALQRIHGELIASPPKRSLIGGKLRWPPVKGLYLWGGVGRGKTHLMDAFHESLPFSRKRRTHFHRFMLEVHERRRRFLEEQDPVALIAEEIAQQTRVLCFDEFFVADIADAMILGRLTEVLFREGVTLVATGNAAPDDLYKDGLQRARFVPAIERIKAHCVVLHLDSPHDHRLRALQRVELYHHPCDTAAEARLAACFEQMAEQTAARPAELVLSGRPIAARALAEGIAWFDFDALCEGPRGPADYVEIALTHHTLLLSHVPLLTAERDDAARRFVHLVDELYDRSVNLIVAAQVPLGELYAGTRLRFEFRRAASRLTEMQSQEYLSRPHLG